MFQLTSSAKIVQMSALSPCEIVVSDKSMVTTDLNILFEYQGSKQPLTITGENAVVKIKEQLGKLGIEIIR